MRYLDPKADLTFKKIFGEHKDLLMSLLNALLPLEKDRQVESLEYLPAELVPDLPLGKNSIVDVRCKDKKGRQFIVEMQMIWTPAFQQRVFFNASKAFVRQLKRNRKYELLQPVYSLNLVNESFMNDYPDEFIHNYNIVHELHSDKIIDGLHLTFVELPKFKPHSIAERKMAVLWLRFLTEINEDTTIVPEELLDNPETSKALKEVEESAYTEQEIDAYEDFWDKLGAERLLLVDSNNISLEKGLALGREEGRAEGLAQGRADSLAEVARAMLAKGMDAATIFELTGLKDTDIASL
ncbi:Rpn family recombination-promoting nuclease/putative transposase [uncultured Prevotella sp.]|uniref:Rpn family recombination-promoting nuclease/putative transposase n=1 Tax=uncultured Prevotella sp. TaxID=159272 RepID=UPI0027E38CA9|nr:Rpn family recombination-promoting nuclease/putative transposase [uncultured Prevotella sp.]